MELALVVVEKKKDRRHKKRNCCKMICSMLIKSCLFITISLFTLTVAIDPFFTGSILAGGVGGMYYYKDKILSKICYNECCNDKDSDKWIISNPNFNDLPDLIFGQHIAIDVVTKLVLKHLNNPKPEKPLVLSFHGWTGVGKNYLSNILADKIYKQHLQKGESNFVHKLSATHLFDKNELKQMIEKVKKGLENCDRSLFIFDEIDKFPETYLDVLLPLLDYSSKYKNSIFIFIGNSGGTSINSKVNQLLTKGINREDIQLSHLESNLIASVNADDGGLKNSELISRGMIDAFVPFLPLEYKHVKQCVIAYLKRNNFTNPTVNPGETFINNVLKQITFKDNYSFYGCRRVSSIVDMLLP